MNFASTKISVMDTELEKKIKDKIKEVIHSEPIEHKIDAEINRQIDNAIKEEVAKEIKQEVTPTQKISKLAGFFRQLLPKLNLGKGQICRKILITALISQAIILFLLLICRLPRLNFCFAGSSQNLTLFLTLVAVAILGVIFYINLASGQLRQGIICSLIFFLPLVIFVLFTSLAYIGLIIIVLVILTVFLGQTRR